MTWVYGFGALLLVAAVQLVKSNTFEFADQTLDVLGLPQFELLHSSL